MHRLNHPGAQQDEAASSPSSPSSTQAFTGGENLEIPPSHQLPHECIYNLFKYVKK